jgi:cytochrome P450
MPAAAPIIRPPGPKSIVPFRMMMRMRKAGADTLHAVAQEFGDLAYFRLGEQDVYFVNDPDLIKDILVTQQSKFTKSRMLQRAKRMLGEGMLTSEGAFHLRQRRLAQPAFHRERLKGYAAAMTDCILDARGRWQDGQTLDLSDEMMRLTLAVVARTLFSADVEQDARDVGEAMETVLGMFEFVLLPWSEFLEKLPLPQVKRFGAARDKLDRIIYRFIAHHRASGQDHGDLLSMLLAAQDDEGGTGGMNDEQVRDELITLFLAGHETTANAMAWSWYLLSQHPEIERRLHDEVDHALAGRAPTFDDLPALRYCEMVMAESMRLYPPVWAIGRMAAVDYRIRDYEVPRGSILIMSPYALQRNPKFYPNPERFDPERWRPEAVDARPKFSYFPFGGGTRVCIGERFAWIEGTLILAAVAQKWRFTLEPGFRVEKRALLTMRPRFGMRMQAHARAQCPARRPPEVH